MHVIAGPHRAGARHDHAFPRSHSDPQPRRRPRRNGVHPRGVPDADPTFYEQTRKALRRIDESLALSGTDKSRVLSAIVYIADIAHKEEMNKAWDEWVDCANPPMRACLGVNLEHPHLVEIVVTAAQR